MNDSTRKLPGHHRGTCQHPRRACPPRSPLPHPSRRSPVGGSAAPGHRRQRRLQERPVAVRADAARRRGLCELRRLPALGDHPFDGEGDTQVGGHDRCFPETIGEYDRY